MSVQGATLKNLAANALRSGYLPVMVEKAWARLTERNRRGEAKDSKRWCADQAEPLADFALSLNAQAWPHAVKFDEALRRDASAKLQAIGVDLGGGGDCRLLHFLVQHLMPETVVETGVAAGFSSQCILSALAENGAGHLFSSDFPYFRLDRPERFVGVLVDSNLKNRWTLHTDGDRKNLPRIVAQTEQIDLIHYDSDKSRSGRSLAMRLLEPQLVENAVIVMDDIQDNLFFRDYANSQSRPWRVFAYMDKHVGLIGL